GSRWCRRCEPPGHRGVAPRYSVTACSWKRLSMAGALAYWPDGSQAALVFQLRPGAYNDHSLIEFLTDLHTHLDGRRTTLIWDGLPSHRSRTMAAWLATQRRWLRVERLPGYAHDLNPTERLWAYLKNSELASLCPDTIDAPAVEADNGLMRIGSDAELCFAFLRHCGLSL